MSECIYFLQVYDFDNKVHDWCGLKDMECECEKDEFSEKCLCRRVSKNNDIEKLKDFVRSYMDNIKTEQAKDFIGDIYWYHKQGAIDTCEVFLERLNKYE